MCKGKKKPFLYIVLKMKVEDKTYGIRIEVAM
jgi:hypothetical protein